MQQMTVIYIGARLSPYRECIITCVNCADVINGELLHCVTVIAADGCDINEMHSKAPFQAITV